MAALSYFWRRVGWAGAFFYRHPIGGVTARPLSSAATASNAARDSSAAARIVVAACAPPLIYPASHFPSAGCPPSGLRLELCDARAGASGLMSNS